MPGQILVRTRARLAETELDRRFSSHDLRQRRTLRHDRIRVINVPEERVEVVLTALRADPEVEFAERDFLAEAAFVPNDTYAVSGDAWHLARMQLPAAWEITTGREQVIVAVLDSGINAAHPDLLGRLLPGFDFVANDADPADDFGHGTAVAGVVSAAGNNQAGSAGAAFGCRLLPVKVMDSTGFATYSAIAEGIRYAVDQGARVINISIAGSSPSITLQSAIDYAWSNNVVVVAAAGNNASSTPQYPAACRHVVAVAATDPADLLASFSTYGSFVSVCAPGVDIWTTQRHLSNPYGAWRGTSLASPLVAGVAALVASVNATLSGDEITEVLRQTADDLGPAGYDDVFAHGRINAARAVLAANLLPGASLPPAELPPAVTVVSPSPATQSPLGAPLTVTAQAVATSLARQVVRVEFHTNGVHLLTVVSAPHTFEWTPPGAGTYSISAVAVDEAGLRGTSAPVVITVSGPESIPPVVTLTGGPKNGARLTSGVLQLTGTASDNTAVARVEVSVNGGAFDPANGTSSWSAVLTLSPGNNLVRVRSVDVAGNVSAEIQLNYTFIQQAMLSVQTVGAGRLSPNLNGRLLEVGWSYTMKALPAKDHIFAGWDGIESQSPVLTFVMAEGLTLTAKFAPSPFLPLKGNFNGLIASPANITPQNSGAFTLTLTSAGSFSGRLSLGGARHSFRGQFNLEGRATVVMNRGLASPLTLTLKADLTGGTDQITGTLTDGGWASQVESDRSVFNARTRPAPQAGSGQFVLEHADAAAVTPAANGLSRISASGKTRVAGRLEDGRKFTAASALARNGDYPFYLSLSRGQEVVIGWVNFPHSPSPGTSGTVVWVRIGTNAFAATLQAASAR